MSRNIEKDERTTFIENKSYKYGYNILSFGLLFDIIYRSIRFNEAPWDLFGLLFLSGIIMTVYQYQQKIFSKNWARNCLFLMIATAILGAVFALMFRSLK